MAIEILEPDKVWPMPFPIDGEGNYRIFSRGKGHSGITTTNRRKFPDGYIYFIKLDDHNVYKIGVSQNPKRRLADIDSYLPFDFTILSLHYFKNVYDIEDMVLAMLKNNKLKREWVTLDVETGTDIMAFLHNLKVKEYYNAPN